MGKNFDTTVEADAVGYNWQILAVINAHATPPGNPNKFEYMPRRLAHSLIVRSESRKVLTSGTRESIMSVTLGPVCQLAMPA
jgi:hypothetical protein